MPPIADPHFEAELELAWKQALGREAKEELKKAAEPAEAPELRNKLLVALPALARVADFAAGPSGSRALKSMAACCSRFFTACHLVRLTASVRVLNRLDRALRFHSLPGYLPASVELDGLLVDLEAAPEIFDLTEEQLRALMVLRPPPVAGVEAAHAIHLLLIEGRPTHPLLAGFSGSWTSDRMVLDPSLLQPLLARKAQDASADNLVRLRHSLCTWREEVLPSSILQSSSSSQVPIEPGTELEVVSNARLAAAAVLQWAWLQVTMKELRDTLARAPNSEQLGVLEQLMLLQPRLTLAKIERRRVVVEQAVEKLRNEPLFVALRGVWRERSSRDQGAEVSTWAAPRRELAKTLPARCDEGPRPQPGQILIRRRMGFKSVLKGQRSFPSAVTSVPVPKPKAPPPPDRTLNPTELAAKLKSLAPVSSAPTTLKSALKSSKPFEVATSKCEMPHLTRATSAPGRRRTPMSLAQALGRSPSVSGGSRPSSSAAKCRPSLRVAEGACTGPSPPGKEVAAEERDTLCPASLPCPRPVSRRSANRAATIRGLPWAPTGMPWFNPIVAGRG